MADHTPIEWTDATWNVITGCSIVSPGCTNCYAMKLAGTRLRNHNSRVGLTRDSAAGPVWTGEVRFNEEWLRQPLQWKRARQIFVVAHGDLFHDSVPTAWLDRIFAVMALSKQHTFQVLTKRPERAWSYLSGLKIPHVRERIEAAARELGYTFRFEGQLLLDFPLRNVLVGGSVEDQRYADQRRAPMHSISDMGWTTWVSYEPALGPVDWTGWDFLKWMVSGGESGQDARPTHPDWHYAARDYCAQHGIAYHFKQWGAWLPWTQFSDSQVDDPPEQTRFDTMEWFEGGWREVGKPDVWASKDGEIDDMQCVGRVGKKAAGRLLDGVEHNGFPEAAHE